MTKRTYPFELSDIAYHPGETLQEVLEANSMSQKELADRTGITKKTVQEIVQGRASLSAPAAVALEKVLGIKATFWLNLQAGYKADLARIEAQGGGSEMNSPNETVPLCNDGETGNVESGCP